MRRVSQRDFLVFWRLGSALPHSWLSSRAINIFLQLFRPNRCPGLRAVNCTRRANWGCKAYQNAPEDVSPSTMPSNHHNSESTPLLHQILPQHIHPDGESGRTGFNPSHFFKVAWKSGSSAAKWANLLWPFVPVAIVLHYAFPGLPIAIFATSYIAMVPVANLLGFAGQEFARKMPKVSGILIETAFGSIVEIILFIILIAKHKAEHGSSEHGNLIPVIQAAILGSIITNLLLCLGLCFFVGGLRQASQKFHASISEVGSGLLLVAGFGLLIPSAYYSALKGSAVEKASKHHEFTEKVLQHNVLRISQVTSILLIIAFFM